MKRVVFSIFNMNAINFGPNLFFQSLLLFITDNYCFLIYSLCSFEALLMLFNFQSTIFSAKMQYNRPCKFSRPWYTYTYTYKLTKSKQNSN